jgi:pilus assembly protein Flp/PilA
MLLSIARELETSLANIREEDGQALAEYGLLLALIAVAALAAVTALGLAIAGQLGTVTGSL